MMEYDYSIAAKKCGVIMPETRLLEKKIFRREAFDRRAGKRFICIPRRPSGRGFQGAVAGLYGPDESNNDSDGGHTGG